MVSPAKPNSTDLPIAKTPKGPETPKQDSIIPADLARQKIPSPESKKKLDENTITPKNDPSPQDISVAKKAQEVLGIEEKVTTASDDGLDFFDELMAEDSPSADVSQTKEKPVDQLEDGLDFFDALMNEETQDGTLPTGDDKHVNDTDAGLDFFDELMTEAEESPKISLSLQVDNDNLNRDEINEILGTFSTKNNSEDDTLLFNPMHLIDTSELKSILDDEISDIDDLIFPAGIQINNSLDRDNLRMFFKNSSNTLYAKSDQSKEEIDRFIQDLKLSPERLASLRVVHLNEDQWKQVTAKLTSLVQQKQNQQKSAAIQTKEEFAEKKEVLESRTPRNSSTVSQKKPANINKRDSALQKDLASQVVEEEILKQERAKLREKRAAEKEHRVIEKEIQTWERKHEEIKRDADVKRRIP